MVRRICVIGATGNQGGSVVRLLLRCPARYSIRAVTRRPHSMEAATLHDLGAEICEADLNDEDQMNAALRDCWGVFAVTNSYTAVSAHIRGWAGLIRG